MPSQDGDWLLLCSKKASPEVNKRYGKAAVKIRLEPKYASFILAVPKFALVISIVPNLIPINYNSLTLSTIVGVVFP